MVLRRRDLSVVHVTVLDRLHSWTLETSDDFGTLKVPLLPYQFTPIKVGKIESRVIVVTMYGKVFEYQPSTRTSLCVCRTPIPSPVLSDTGFVVPRHETRDQRRRPVYPRLCLHRWQQRRGEYQRVESRMCGDTDFTESLLNLPLVGKGEVRECESYRRAGMSKKNKRGRPRVYNFWSSKFLLTYILF